MWISSTAVEMQFYLILCLLIICYQCVDSVAPANGGVSTKNLNARKLLIVSYDGFRNEYFQRNVTEYMNEFRKNGTYADYMKNVFPTKTFPNHHSISTGKFPNEHGVLANFMFDKKLGKLNYSYEMFHMNGEDVQPIWIINEKSDPKHYSGCYMWPGSDFAYNGTNCTHREFFNKTKPWNERVDTMISWFTDPLKPINLGMLYIEDPDTTSHPYGTTNRITEVVRRLDTLTKYIQEKLLEYHLDINVIHLSDHGMADVTPPNFINLTKFVDADSVKFYGTSPVLQVVPNQENSTNKVFEQLLAASKTNGNFKVYTQKTLPERWNFQNDRRTGPITVVAELGFGFQDMWDAAKYFEKNYNVSITSTHNYGIHGYDNSLPDMHPFFMAKGPLIKEHHKVKPFDTVDLFDLFAEILDIKLSVKTSGHRENIVDILIKSNGDDSEKGHMSKWVIMLISSIISFCAVSVIATLIILRLRRRRENMVPQYLYEEPDTIIEGQKLLNSTGGVSINNDAEV